MKIHARAAESAKAPLTHWSYDSTDLGAFGVIVKITACGICHSDLHMIDNDWGMTQYPFVPGHEVVGHVVEKGSMVTLKIGARVGIGWQRSACLECDDCLRGNENLCANSTGVITHGHGGFGDHLVMDSRFCFALPEGVADESAGPLMCGGITVYSALRHAGMGSGQHIGVIGVGGLGHMAVQFAANLGNRVTAITSSEDKAQEAAKLGAHDALIIPRGGEPKSKPTRPFDIILNTSPAVIDLGMYINFCAADATIALVGAPSEPQCFPVFPLLTKRIRIMGSPIGGRAIMRDMLRISDEYGIVPVIEEFPLSDVNTALDKVRNNTIRYRAVLKM
jgi:uncharacterized zinc-type alcohol dehydrogenase-like protein